MQPEPREQTIFFRGSTFALRDLWIVTAQDLNRLAWMILRPSFFLLGLYTCLRRLEVSQSLEDLDGITVVLSALALVQHYAGSLLGRRLVDQYDTGRLHRVLYVFFSAALVSAHYNTENNELLNDVCRNDRIASFSFEKNRNLHDRFQLPDSAFAACKSLEFGDLRRPYDGDVNRQFMQQVIGAAARLKSFNGYGSAVNTEALAVLVAKQSESLEELDLGMTSLDSEKLKTISQFKNLRTLTLQFTSCEAGTLAEILAGCEKLEILRLSRCKIKGELVLKQPSKLLVLDIGDTKLEQSALVELVSKTELVSLGIADNRFVLTDHASAKLAQLTHLTLGGEQYNDKALEVILRRCKALQQLELYFPSVSDEGIKLVKENPQIQSALIYTNAGLKLKK